MTHGLSARMALTLTTAGLAMAACVGGTARVSGADGADARNGQNWTAKEQYAWYRGSQGSRLVPLTWLQAVEEEGSTQPLMSSANIASYGYLPASASDPSQLPLGFARDRSADKDLGFTKLRWFTAQRERETWVGMNCSACHTAEMTFHGTTLRVDGGPTLADFQRFTGDLDKALARTAADPAKFARFARAVLGAHPRNADLGPEATTAHDSPADRAKLMAALVAFNARQAELRRLNGPETFYGNGRLDAVGHILNRIAFLNAAAGQFGGPANAPVSYPFLWNINQHDFVQWNGIAPNKGAHFPSGETFDIGALVRNASEVAGVFADISVTNHASVDGFKSSISATNLDAMEAQIGLLTAPAWPAAFGPLDQTRVERGRQLFEQHCQGCHAILERTDRTTPIKAAMTPVFGPRSVGTDPWMACNAFTYQARTGQLRNMPRLFLAGAKYGEVDFTRSMLVTTTVGALAGKKRQIAATSARAAFGLPRRIEVTTTASGAVGQRGPEDRLRDCTANRDDQLMAYKGRPLNGVWATAPYLHNGSVRTLYQLLLPPARRETSFWVGNREYDPRDAGYVNARGTRGTLFEVAPGGQAIAGNANTGHDYGNAGFTDDQRYELIEFLKSR